MAGKGDEGVLGLTPVVLMAGGRGLRLHPLTEHQPKPMLKVGGKPILEQIVEGFSGQGFRSFWFCVGYKAELIEKHFGSGSGRGVRIRYVHETEPLGTGGALNLLPSFDRPFIVCNADVLTKIDYGRLMEFHARSGAKATICLALHQYQVPYGVAKIEGDRLASLQEKPIESWPVNAGIYVLEPDVLAGAPKGRFEMTDLIAKFDKVAVYPIDGFWIDVGHFEHLLAANQEWA